jgi:RNA polymerase sigma-70 factor (family 1)
MNEMTDQALLDEKLLLARIAEGDESAFRIIYNKYSKRVFLFSMSVLNSEQHAEEVVQEAMLKIWLMASDLKKINNFEAYLRTLTRNRSLNVLSRLQLELKTSKDLGEEWEDIDNGTEEGILLNDTRKVLQAGLNALPPQQKLIYHLSRHEGLKYDEIAQQLSLSPSTVQTHMKLALKFLRNYVKQHTDITVLLIILKLF